MSWFALMDLIERRNSLKINSDRELLTENQNAVLGRLMSEEYDDEMIRTVLTRIIGDSDA